MTTSIKIQKQADIRYRVELKSRPRIVIYKVRSSDDTQTYDVTLVGGKVNNCTCKARKPCYHMHDVQIREDARRQAAATVAMDELATEQDEALRFSPWHGSNPSTEVERPIDERGSLNHTARGFQLMR